MQGLIYYRLINLLVLDCLLAEATLVIVRNHWKLEFNLVFHIERIHSHPFYSNNRSRRCACS